MRPRIGDLVKFSDHIKRTLPSGDEYLEFYEPINAIININAVGIVIRDDVLPIPSEHWRVRSLPGVSRRKLTSNNDFEVLFGVTSVYVIESSIEKI